MSQKPVKPCTVPVEKDVTRGMTAESTGVAAAASAAARDA